MTILNYLYGFLPHFLLENNRSVGSMTIRSGNFGQLQISFYVPASVKFMDNKKSLEEYRDDFPALKQLRNGKPPVYMDSACTTLVPQQIIDAINDYYTRYPGCSSGRSRHWFADEVNDRIEGNPDKGIKGSRCIVADFINAASENEIIFTLNATHAINTVALGFKFQPGDTVLITNMEHNSNLVPWLRLQKTGRIKLDYIVSNHEGIFDFDTFEEKLKNSRVRLVSMAYTANSTGVSIPAKEIIKLAHFYGAKVLLDGAQAVPHKKVDAQDLDVDFLAFSMHKMCGPRGVGVLYGKKELLGSTPQEENSGTDVIEPVFLGGGTVADVTYKDYSLLEPPKRFEAGIQNYPGQIASGATIQYLQNIGMERIAAQETKLNNFLTEELIKRYGDTGWFRILGPRDAAQRGGILSFEVHRPNAVGIAAELSEKSNVMIRDGVFCAHAYFNEQFGQGWAHPRSHAEHRMIYRVSLYFYNTIEECRVFLETLDEIFKERSYI
jgi:cysteine desulfurase/selenocysteine lyase